MCRFHDRQGKRLSTLCCTQSFSDFTIFFLQLLPFSFWPERGAPSSVTPCCTHTRQQRRPRASRTSEVHCWVNFGELLFFSYSTSCPCLERKEIEKNTSLVARALNRNITRITEILCSVWSFFFVCCSRQRWRLDHASHFIAPCQPESHSRESKRRFNGRQSKKRARKFII